MEHLFEAGQSDKTLVLFHGTGGSLRDLVGIAEYIDPEANVLALEGDVVEGKLKRFFKRIEPGVFDQDDLVKRTRALEKNLHALCDRYSLRLSKMVLMGYSNGANLIGSYLSFYGEQPAGAILFQPMRPFKDVAFKRLERVPVFIASGRNDPIVANDESQALIDAFEKGGATLKVHWHDHGHSLTEETISKARQFYRTHML